MTFVLGAEDNSLNDFPELYRNGPLQPNTEYTAFVWGFVPSVPVSVNVHRVVLLLGFDQSQGCIKHLDSPHTSSTHHSQMLPSQYKGTCILKHSAVPDFTFLPSLLRIAVQ